MSTERRIGAMAVCYSVSLLMLFTAGFFPALGCAQDQGQNPLEDKNILILNAFESNVPAFEKNNEGLSAALQSGGIAIRNQFFENLDLRRNSSPEYLKLVTELIRQRYGNREIDFIFTLYPEALLFLLNEGRTIFPHVPIMALYLPKTFKAPKTERHIIPHIVMPDLKRTLAIALKLAPKTKRVYVVSGTYPMDKWLEDRARQDFKAWEGRLEFQYLSEQPLEEILAAVSGAVPDSIVFLTAFGQDAAGKYRTTVEVAKQLSRVSKAPVFGILDVLLGAGIVGGSLISFEYIGTEAGKMALKILRGPQQKENTPAILEARQLDMFDWRQIKRWNLSESALPGGSIIVNREFSLWDLKYYIIGALAFILAQSFLIVSLLTQKRRRSSAEASLRRKSEELDQFFNVSLDLLCIANTEGYFQLLNPAWESALGYTREELMSKRFVDFVHPDDVERTRRAISTLKSQGKVVHFDNRYLGKDGAYRWLEWSSVLAGDLIYAAARDVTNRLRAEAEAGQRRDELAHVTRIASMGELTTSLAHEINQPLTAILSNAEAAQRFLSMAAPDIGEVRQILEDIIRDDKRAGDVVRKVRALVRKDKLSHEPLDLRQVIQEVVDLIRGELIQQGISTTIESSPHMVMIRGDRIQLQQVILNLILNSAAAMRNSPPNQRRITIKTSTSGNGSVKASVTDFGTGVDENNIERLFEPFYTTKPEGLGMGLSISQTIINTHGGSMEVSNNPYGGATVSFNLPSSREDQS